MIFLIHTSSFVTTILRDNSFNILMFTSFNSLEIANIRVIISHTRRLYEMI